MRECKHPCCQDVCRKKKPEDAKRRYIRKVSEKRQTENEIYKVLRKDFLKDHPNCECGQDGCKDKATEIHHSKGRGRYFLVVETWRAVSRRHHRWAEMNPMAAKQSGASQSRLNDDIQNHVYNLLK